MAKKRKKVKHYRASKGIVGFRYEDALSLSAIQVVAGSIGGAILLNITRMPDYLKYILFFLAIFAILVGISWGIYGILAKKGTWKQNLKRALAVSGIGFLMVIMTTELSKYFIPGQPQSVFDFDITQPTAAGQIHPLTIPLFMAAGFLILGIYLYFKQK